MVLPDQVLELRMLARRVRVAKNARHPIRAMCRRRSSRPAPADSLRPDGPRMLVFYELLGVRNGFAC